MRRECHPLECLIHSLDGLDIDADGTAIATMAGNCHGDFTRVGDGNDWYVINLLRPESADLRLSMLIGQNRDVRRTQRYPIAFLDEETDRVLRNNSSHEPFDTAARRSLEISPNLSLLPIKHHVNQHT